MVRGTYSWDPNQQEFSRTSLGLDTIEMRRMPPTARAQTNKLVDFFVNLFVVV